METNAYPELLSLATAAAKLGISRPRLAYYVAAGRIRETVIDGYRFVPVAELDRFAALPRKPGRPARKPPNADGVPTPCDTPPR